MTKEPKRPAISSHMQRALTDATMAGGLHRWPGGYWRVTPWTRDAVADPNEYYHKTTTIDALVGRGLGHFSVIKEGPYGKFGTTFKAGAAETTPEPTVDDIPM